MPKKYWIQIDRERDEHKENHQENWWAESADRRRYLLCESCELFQKINFLLKTDREKIRAKENESIFSICLFPLLFLSLLRYISFVCFLSPSLARSSSWSERRKPRVIFFFFLIIYFFTIFALYVFFVCFIVGVIKHVEILKCPWTYGTVWGIETYDLGSGQILAFTSKTSFFIVGPTEKNNIYFIQFYYFLTTKGRLKGYIPGNVCWIYKFSFIFYFKK